MLHQCKQSVIAGQPLPSLHEEVPPMCMLKRRADSSKNGSSATRRRLGSRATASRVASAAP